MKVRIEVDEQIQEEEIIIKCPLLNETVLQIQQSLNQILTGNKQIVFYKGETEYYFSPTEVLFFETEGCVVNAHTADNVYQVKYKLYELEELLPSYFMRISKSGIVNTHHIYSICRNLTASSIIEFKDTHKKVLVSRYYYKPLKDKLEEKRKF